MQKQSFSFPFIAGIILGVLGTVFLPGYVRPYLPEWIAGKTVVVKGIVEAKQKKDSVLLLTVETPEGVLLATFNEKVDEVNLLIREKNSIEFTLPKYMPFIEDPKIVRVAKEEQPMPEPVPAAKPKEQGAKEAKPKHQEKQPAGVSAPGSGSTGTKAAKQK